MNKEHTKPTKQAKNTPPPKNKRKKLTLQERKQFAKYLVENKLTAKQAYQVLRPEVSPETAKNQGVQLKHDSIVQLEVKKALERNNIDINYTLSRLKTSIDTGIGKKATNRDAIMGLKLLSEIQKIKDPEVEALNNDRQYLQELSHNELLEQLNEVQATLEELVNKNDIKESAINGEIVTDSKEL